MLTKLGDRVYVKTPLFEGWATVVAVFPGELLPVQIELDNGDDDGHRLKRVSETEVIEIESSTKN